MPRNTSSARRNERHVLGGVFLFSTLSTLDYPYIRYLLGGTGTYSPYVPYNAFLWMKSSGTGNVEIEICDFKDEKIRHIWWIFYSASLVL
jgi:hypothetical protein